MTGRDAMDVQCEQHKCGKTIDMHDEAYFCKRCQQYYCEKCYELYHEDHDLSGSGEPNWCLSLQRQR